jgi:hypothetical protein
MLGEPRRGQSFANVAPVHHERSVPRVRQSKMSLCFPLRADLCVHCVDSVSEEEVSLCFISSPQKLRRTRVLTDATCRMSLTVTP